MICRSEEEQRERKTIWSFEEEQRKTIWLEKNRRWEIKWWRRGILGGEEEEEKKNRWWEIKWWNSRLRNLSSILELEFQTIEMLVC